MDNRIEGKMNISRSSETSFFSIGAPFLLKNAFSVHLAQFLGDGDDFSSSEKPVPVCGGPFQKNKGCIFSNSGCIFSNSGSIFSNSAFIFS